MASSQAQVGESKLFEREPVVVVPVAVLAAISHEGAVGRQVPRGPPALSMEAWSSAAQEAGIATMDQASSSAGAVQNHKKMEMDQRAFGAINTTVVQGDPDGSEHGPVADPNRGVARDDRTFARSTAKLTPALFAEMTGGSFFFLGQLAPPDFDSGGLRGRAAGQDRRAGVANFCSTARTRLVRRTCRLLQVNWSVIAKWSLEVFGKGAGSSWAVLILPIEPSTDLECFGLCARQKVNSSVARYSVCDDMSFRICVKLADRDAQQFL